MADALARAAASAPEELPDVDALAAAARALAEREDPVHGGFGGAPKFPVATTLSFLQAPLVRATAPEAAASAERALAAMARSALHDADGGFFRYATQRDWSVPHYERMLTDNAQLLDAALAAGEEDTARGIAGFLLTTLRRDGGAFGAAQDSESWIDGVRSEGGYYRRSLSERTTLAPPAVDGKVISGWNGLAIGALARAGLALGEPSWTSAAAEAAEHVLGANRASDGALVRLSLDGVASAAVATTADLALLADGLLALALATGDATWAERGRAVLDDALAGVRSDGVLDAQGIGLSPDQTDGDLPSDAAATALAALSAWRLGAGEAYRDAAAHRVREHAASARLQPFAHGSLLRAAAGLAAAPRQIVAVTAHPSGALADAVRRADADVVAIVSPAQARAFAEAGFDLFAHKDAGAERVYDCQAFICRLPVSAPEQVRRSRTI